jgi:predicted phosphate transport protein (TIGR00153 family)
VRFLFRRTRELEAQIDEFLNAVSEGCVVFELGIRDFLENRCDRFEERIAAISALEASADQLRRSIENRLYSHSLIPEHRGDVLGLLENMDNVIDAAKKTLLQFAVENPEILAELVPEYLELAHASVAAAQELVAATRAFFKDINAVQNSLHKVHFFEKEADRVALRLKRRVFEQEIDLSRKFHHRYFALHIESISDRAEEVADRLAIYTIKRTL